MSKLYKLIKITRLIRLVKVLKGKSQNHLNQVSSTLRLSKGLEKLAFFFMLLMLMCHFVACIWIFTAKNFGGYEDDDEETTNWIEAGEFGDFTMGQLYITSFYFAVTTITTVGYGDINGTSTPERWICFFMHLVGVLSYSFAAGSLSNII